jgi:hypothetical protein
MRYPELLGATPSSPESPLIRPRSFRGTVKLVIRLMPAVYRWINLTLRAGEPNAKIRIDRATVSHPEVYDSEGALTPDCRRWIIENVHDVVARIGLRICIVFSANDAIYCWPNGVLVIAPKPPEGGLLL